MKTDPRLAQAFEVFLQYGFRKTSMSDIAREVGISRQALYKQYGNKQALFEAVATHTQGVALREAEDALTKSDTALIIRLTKALDIVAGQFIEKLRNSYHGTEIIQIAEEGEASRQCQHALRVMLQKHLANDPELPSNKRLDDRIDVLLFVIKGLIHDARSPEEFRGGIQKALTVLFT